MSQELERRGRQKRRAGGLSKPEAASHPALLPPLLLLPLPFSYPPTCKAAPSDLDHPLPPPAVPARLASGRSSLSPPPSSPPASAPRRKKPSPPKDKNEGREHLGPRQQGGGAARQGHLSASFFSRGFPFK